MISEEDGNIDPEEASRLKIEEDPQIRESEKGMMYRTDETPPWITSLVLALQQMFFCIGFLITAPAITMPLLCADDSPTNLEHHRSLIGTSLFAAGFSTFIQTTFGVRLPVFQGPATAYVVAVIAIMSGEEWKCPPPLDTKINSTDGNLTVERNISNNLLFDTVTNSTIELDPQSNYYRDNDGVIRNSNELWIVRLNVIQGAVIMGSAFQILIAMTGAIGFLMRYIGPLTIAPILTMVTYGIVGPIWKMSSQNWAVSLITTASFYITSICLNRVLVPLPKFYIKKKRIVVSLTRQPIFSMFSVVFSLAIGWTTSYIVNLVNGAAENESLEMGNVVASSPWFRLPYPFQFGWPIFRVSAMFGMLVAIISGILESIGDYNATASVCKEKLPPTHAVNRGILMEGVGILVNGVLGTGNATTSWSTNIVLIDTTKVASRRVFQYCGVLIMLLGLFTKTLSVFTLLPEAVIGGMMCATVGVIMSVGVATLKRVNMQKSRNLFVYGFSVLFGMVLSEFVSKNPSSIDVGNEELNSIILGMMRNPLWVSGFTGFVLDNITPGSRKSRGLEVSEDSMHGMSQNLNAYNPPFWADCKCNKWVPICPGLQQSRDQRAV